MQPFVPPALRVTAFNCPSCDAYAVQSWHVMAKAGMPGNPTAFQGFVAKWQVATCNHCSQPSIWLNEAMIYPTGGGAPAPNVDLLDDLRSDYEEARAIQGRSPRGAAALLRLVIQKLCKFLGEKGRNIDDDIASLVKKGLSVDVQRALDAVRVIGNEAVHPGQLDLTDDQVTAVALFQLVNIVTEKMISEPKRVAAVYATLPKNKLTAIEKRDGQQALLSGPSANSPPSPP